MPKPVDEPIPTVTTAHGGGNYLVVPSADPFVLGQQSGSAPRSTDAPLPTVATDGAISLVEPMLARYNGHGDASPIQAPVPTITTKPRFGLVQPFIVPQFGEAPGQAPRVHDIDEPLPAVTSHGAGRVVQPMAMQCALTHQAGPDVRSADEPVYTITTGSRPSLIEPVLRAIESGHVDPRRVVLIDGVPHLLDIRFRMLTNAELARAMGFEDDETAYEFVGTVQEITRQIGNAVPVNMAKALVAAILRPMAVAREIA